MGKIKFVVHLVAVALIVSSCSVKIEYIGGSKKHTVTASRNMVTNKLDVGEFRTISLVGTPDVVYTQKPGDPSVTVTCPDNLVGLLDIRTSNGTLVVKMKDGTSVRGNAQVTVTASSRALGEISLSGTGNVTARGELSAKDFKASVRGTGNIEIGKLRCDIFGSSVQGTGNIRVGTLLAGQSIVSISGTGNTAIGYLDGRSVEATVSGTGDISLKGRVANAFYSCVGTGKIMASGLAAMDVGATMRGVGRIECNAQRTLDANIAGVGTVNYVGSPRIKVNGKRAQVKPLEK